MTFTEQQRKNRAMAGNTKEAQQCCESAIDRQLYPGSLQGYAHLGWFTAVRLGRDSPSTLDTMLSHSFSSFNSRHLWAEAAPIFYRRNHFNVSITAATFTSTGSGSSPTRCGISRRGKPTELVPLPPSDSKLSSTTAHSEECERCQSWDCRIHSPKAPNIEGRF